MFKRVVLMVFLIMVVAVGAIHAVPQVAGPRPTSDSGVLDRLWNWLAHLLPTASQGDMKSTWDAEGSHLDPNGNH